MSLLLLLVFTWQLGTATDSGDPALERESFLSGQLQLLVPKTFLRVDEASLQRGYPNERRPTLVLSSPDGAVHMAITHTSNPLSPSDLASAHAEFEQTLRALYPAAVWHRSELVTLEGRNFFALDLRTTSSDTGVRSLMLGTSLEGRFLLLSFSCLQAREPSWLPVGRRILESVRLAPRDHTLPPPPG